MAEWQAQVKELNEQAENEQIKDPGSATSDDPGSPFDATSTGG
jgi:hypothetical protein